MYEKLERIEWTNYWREDSAGKERVLLIGDSITSGYKSIVHRELGGKLCVTAMMTSKSAANPHFCEEIEMVARQEDYCYKIVQLNSGLHSGGQSEEEYEANLEKIILFIKKILPNDFLANFYEVATGNNLKALTKSIREINVEENYASIDSIVSFLIRSLQAEYLLELNNLIERAYKSRDLVKFERFSTLVSEESSKVQMGVYETKLPRDAFIA